LTVKLEHLETLIQKFGDYCEDCITDDHLIKSVKVDTKIYEHEREDNILAKIDKLAPFGEGNKEPVFLLENVHIHKIEKV
jgi:single-stranded DNA-specific DHH superfamily exonuclease